jgi:hypothetical protein
MRLARSIRTIETKIPRALADKADKRARQIFEQECRYGRSFSEAIGAVYMIGIQAGIESTLGKEPYNETAGNAAFGKVS